MEHDQAASGDQQYPEIREEIMSRCLAEGQHRLLLMQLKCMGKFHRSQTDFVNLFELLKWMEEQVNAQTLERHCLENEFVKLSVEVQRLRSLCTSREVVEGESSFEDLNFKAGEEGAWITMRRTAMAQLTADASGHRLPSADAGAAYENFSLRSISSTVAIAPSSDIVSAPRVWAAGSSDAEASAHKKTESSKFITDAHLKGKKTTAEGQYAIVHYTSEESARKSEFKEHHEEVEVLDAALRGRVPAENDKCAIRTETRKRKVDPVDNAASFKFVAPVRKKADREKLVATKCTLCTPFYDAMMLGDAEAMLGCRYIHVDNSRPRFLDLPPSTPEGFWNIGFNTESPE